MCKEWGESIKQHYLQLLTMATYGSLWQHMTYWPWSIYLVCNYLLHSIQRQSPVEEEEGDRVGERKRRDTKAEIKHTLALKHTLAHSRTINRLSTH